jgi:hypothetical protein
MIFNIIGAFRCMSNKVAENFKRTKFNSSIYPKIVDLVGYVQAIYLLSKK